MPEFAPTARGNILRTLKALRKLPRYLPSGLFYSRYTAGSEQTPPRVADDFLSSIDNLHLAFALWAVGEAGPASARVDARTLFSAMKLDFFYDPQDGLFVGGARWKDGRLVREEWKYRYLGSEARSLYSIGWALGLVHDPDFIAKSTESLEADLFERNEIGYGREELLGLWDGGAFQLLLPRLLISEERYLPRLGKMFKAYGRYVLEEGKRLGFPVPASYSACQLDLFSYAGRAGSLSLVTPRDPDTANPGLRANWEGVFTPHAAFLAAPLMAHEFSQALEAAEGQVDAQATPLYRPGLGWMDALHVRGEHAGQVVPVQLSLDQEMIALAASQTEEMSLNEGTRMTEGARLLHANALTRARLTDFFQAIKGLLDRAPRYELPVENGN
jgi:hypothetical protein